MPISALPTPPTREDPANFRTRADQFLAALPTFATEANTLETNVNAKEASAVSAAASATADSTAAAGSASSASASATSASASAVSAAASAAAADGAAKTDVANTWTAPQSFDATQKVRQALELVKITAGAPAATQHFDLLTGAIQYFTSNGANNWTLNVRGDVSTTLNSLMVVGQSATLCVKATMGATPYYASAMTIDGSAVTPKWIGGTAPTAGDASCINVYTYTIIKTADATFTVIASKSKTS